MCSHGHQKIFINSGGEFRRKIKSRPHCLSQQSDCSKILEKYLESNAEKQFKYDERADLTCRKDSFRNVDSGSDLQCSWLGSGRPGLEAAECLERKYKYQPRTFTANQIVCCRDTGTSVFNPQAGLGRPPCSEGLLAQCKQDWTEWSGWEVYHITILTSQGMKYLQLCTCGGGDLFVFEEIREYSLIFSKKKDHQIFIFILIYIKGNFFKNFVKFASNLVKFLGKMKNFRVVVFCFK